MLAAGSTGAGGAAGSTDAGGAAGGCWRSDIGGIGAFSRSSGMAGGGMGGCPLISSGPLALLMSVAHPPLPKVAPMLHDTWRLPAVQLGSDTVL